MVPLRISSKIYGDAHQIGHQMGRKKEDNMDGKAHAHGSEDVGLSIADCDRRASASLRCVDVVVDP